jgi:hypothetical protein
LLISSKFAFFNTLDENGLILLELSRLTDGLLINISIDSRYENLLEFYREFCFLSNGLNILLSF